MKTAGEILKEARLKKGLSYSDVEEATKIRKGILRDLEEGNWSGLPPTYVKGLLKNYGEAVGLDEKRVLAFFRREFDEKKAPSPPNKPVERNKRFIRVTPALITSFLISLVTAGIIFYLFVQYQSFTAAPKLEIVEPADNTKISSLEINVIGQSWSDATVKINGEKIQVSPGGAFSVLVGLKEGVNLLTITSENRFGKIRSVKRTVAVEKAAVSLGADTIEKTLNLDLEIVKKSTQMRIEVDGKEVFSGLMLLGSKKIFVARGKIKIWVEDAVSAKIIIDGEELVLGKEGESVEKEFILKN